MSRNGGPLGEALGMGDVRGVEDDLALLDSLAGQTVVDIGRRQHAKAIVMVLVVVPIEEFSAVLTCVLDAPKAFRKTWPVLERLEV
jgi:hypothetical protein